jgi:hypothetical protein
VAAKAITVEAGGFRSPQIVWTANVIVTFSGDATLAAKAADDLELANPSARGAEAFSGEGLPPPSREPC